MKSIKELGRSISKTEAKKISGGAAQDCGTDESLYHCTVQYAGGASMQGYSCGSGDEHDMALELALRDIMEYDLDVVSSNCFGVNQT